jgi:hypothetical protein
MRSFTKIMLCGGIVAAFAALAPACGGGDSDSTLTGGKKGLDGGALGGSGGSANGGSGGNNLGGTAGGSAGSGGAGTCATDDECTALLPETSPAACAEAKCDALTKQCQFTAKDSDGDGHAAKDCEAVGSGNVEAGDDCDDDQASTFPGSGVEKCNGKDDDCDGKVDAEDTDGPPPNSTEACTVGVGECAATGVKTCEGGDYLGCSVGPGTPGSDSPACDGKDYDCDGAPNTGCDCTVGAPDKPCGDCGGKQKCVLGKWSTCDKPNPPNWNGSCNSCGGKVQCNGTCSPGQPGNFGSPCNECGSGTIQCNGGCSASAPSNLGQACNSCGATWQCNGTCAGGYQPPNYGQACGSCGGTINCGGSCTKNASVITQPDPGYQGPYSDWGNFCHNCSGAGPNQIFDTHYYSGAISNSSPWSVTGTVTMSYVGGGCFNNFDEAVVVDCYDSLPGCAAPWTYVGSVSLKQNEYNVPRQLPTVTTPGHTLCCDYRKTDKEWTPCWQGCCNRNIQTTWQATSCQ